MALLLIGAMSHERFGQSSAFAATKIIPSVSISERYDSNVFFAPASFARTRWDFVTAVSPLVEVQSKNRYVDTSFNAGVSGNAFINNPDLDFISTSVSGSANLDGVVGRVIRGARLQIADSFLFTPEPPAFLTGGKPEPTADPFTRGIQSVRANTFRNTALARGSYIFSKRMSLLGEYSHSIYRVGQLFLTQNVGVPVAFFDSNLQRWSIGPSIRLARTDNMSILYSNIQSNQRPAEGGGRTVSFTAQAVEAQYVRTMPGWTLTVNGGATVLEQGDPFFSGRLSLVADYDAVTRVTIAASRRIAPAFFVAGGAVVSTIGSVSIDRRLSKVLRLRVAGNYGINETTPINLIKYETYTASATLAYRLTRTMEASIFYEYNFFGIRPQEGQGFLAARNAVTFSLTTTWK